MQRTFRAVANALIVRPPHAPAAAAKATWSLFFLLDF